MHLTDLLTFNFFQNFSTEIFLETRNICSNEIEHLSSNQEKAYVYLKFKDFEHCVLDH